MSCFSWNCRAAAVLLAAMLAGCGRDEPRVYEVPKENPPAQAESAPATEAVSMPPPPSAPPAPSAPPQLNYRMPAGWKEKPLTEMRVASFIATDSKGNDADVSVIPLPVAGRDLELINMWRSRVQLPPTADPSAVNQATPVAIGSEQGRLFEFVSEKPIEGKARQRIIVAKLAQPGMSWFFKISGNDQTVIGQKDNFLQFLKSISFAGQGTSGTTPVAEVPSEKAIWDVPAGWKAVTPAEFLLAEFSVSDASGAKAEVNVAELNGTGGGMSANVNRWRGQLALPPLTDDQLASLAKTVEVPGGSATLFDFTGTNPKSGTPSRLIGAIVAQGDHTWFYKLMGDKQVVAQQKEAFTRFVQSANYANAR